MKYIAGFAIVLFLSMLLQSPFSFARSGPQGITIEGNILTSANLPEEAASVSFTIQIKSPGIESCVLYQESQTLNMNSSGGVFSLAIGIGARGGSGYESTSTLKSAFSNSTAALTGLNCANGSIYTPASNDKRLVLLTFDDGSGAQSITQALDVQTVPYAMYADTLQGKTPTDLIQVNTTTKAVSQANIESVFDSNADVAALVALINGTSSLYAQPGGSNAFTGAVSFTTAPTTTSAPTTSTSIVNKTYADGSIAGKAIDSTTLSSITAGTLPAGDVLSWNGTNWAASPSSDSTKLPLAGGTMTGSIAMGGKDITNTGYITIAGSHYLGLGVYTDTSEATLVSSLNSTYAGVTWYNSTSNQVKFWNGTTTVALGAAGSGLQSLNGLTGTTQTFANGTSGTAPAFSSSGTTHTLNIPMASSVGTTAGLVSNTDYATFGKAVLKDGTVAFSADESMGSHKLTNLTDPASSQDAATKNYADLHVAGLTLDPSFSTLVSNSIGQGSLLTWDQTNNRWTAAQPAASGSVTSVGLSLPSIFTVTNSPVTSTGTLTGSLASQTGNTVFAGPTSGSGVPSFRTLNIGDLKSSVAGPLFVAPNCSASQTLTWTAVTDNFNCQSIGSLSWSAISSGLPTTLGGYGITDAVANAGGTPSVQSGLDSAKPATTTAGAIFVASDTKTIYQYNSGAWVAIASSNGSGGTLTALTGDVSASGAGSVAATVNAIGGSTAANVHAAELLASAATSLNTVSTLVKRDASGNFTAGTASLTSASVSSLVLKDSGSNTVTLQAPTTVTGSYVLKLPAAVGGINQVLTTDATGNLSWSTPTTGTVTGVSVTGPITNSGTATVPNIGITMSGDATIASGGTLTLKNTGTAGTYTKVTTDAQGRVSSATNIGSSDVTTALGFAPVNKAGDTMSGTLAMGGNNITGVGNVTMNAQNTLLMGTYTAAQETTLVAALTNTSTDIGKTWYNSTSSQIKYWNGSTAVTLGAAGSGLQSLNGLTGSTQTFANGTSGTAPAFASSSTTHTLNIPMASGAGTTAGLLSNTDYTTFGKSILKDGTVAFTADQSMGSHKLTNVTDPVSAQDSSTKNYSDSNVAGKAVATSVATAVTSSAGNGFVLTWNQAANDWTAVAPATSGTVTSVGLSLPSIFTVTGSPVTSTGTLTGTLASQSANLFLASPNGTAGAPTMRSIASGDLPTVPVAKGGTGVTSLTPNGLLMADGTGSSVTSPVCGSGMGYVSNGASFACTTIPSATTGFVNGGNSFGAASSIGNNDNFDLNVKTNNVTRMTVQAGGNVGVGTTSPGAPLDVKGAIRMSGATSGYTGFQPAAAAGSTVWTLPAADGTANQVLKTDGAGALGWASGSTGTVTNIATGTGLTGGPITTTGTISLASIGANTVLANATGAGAVPTATSISSIIDGAIGSTQGSVLYRSGTAWTALTPGTAGQFLSSGGAAANPSWASGATGTVTSVTGTAPISVATGTTTPAISIATANTTTTGAISSTDWNTFNGKLSPTLTSANVFVGNGSNVATGVALSGDATISNSGALTLGTVSVAKGGTGSTTQSPNGIIMANGAGTALTSNFCTTGQALVATSATTWGCQAVTSGSTGFINGGNAFGANATIGLTDAFNLAFKTSNATQMTLDSTGKLGIGIAAPTSLLQTSESSAKTAAYTGVLHTVSNTSSTASVNKIGMDIESTGAWTGTSAVNTGLVVNATGGTTNYAATFSGGNVGIGTTTPSDLLTVNGNIRANGIITVTSAGALYNDGSSNLGIKSASGVMKFFDSVGTTPYMTINTGNVGIGTTSPAGKLVATYDSTVGGVAASTATLDSSDNTAATFSLVARSKTGAGAVSTALVVRGDGNVGIGTTSPGAPLDVKGAIRMSGATSGYTGFQPAAAAGSTVWTLPAADGTSNQVLTTNGSGVLAWSTPAGTGISSLNGLSTTSQTFATPGTSGTAPAWVSSGAAHTLNIPLASTASVTAGLLSNADYTSLSAKMSSTLTSGQIHVGNVSNVATGVAPSGDVTMTNAGAFSVTKLQGSSVSATAPTTNGQALRWNGSAWTPAFVSMFDLRSIVTGTSAFGGVGCTSNQTLTWTAATDNLSCSNVSLPVGQITGTLPVANGGTGQSTLAVGDLLYASGTTALSRLPAGTNGQVLTLASGVPSWAAASGGLPAANGTAAAPTINFTNSTGTGLFRAGADILGLATAGSERMRIDASGNVGIGITNSSQKLAVGGTLAVGADLTIMNCGSLMGCGNYGNFSFTDSTGNLNYTASGGSGRNVTFNSGGNVGVGTTSPPNKLTVQTATNTYGIEHTDGTIRMATYVGGVQPGGWFGTETDHPLIFYTNNSNAQVTLRQTGSVEVGSGGTSNADPSLAYSNLGQLSILATNNALSFGNAATNPYSAWIQSHSSSNLALPLSLNPSGGNVGIGTTTPAFPLDVNGNGNFAGYLQLNRALTTGGSTAFPAYAFFTSNDSGMHNPASQVVSFVTASSERMRISSAGNVGIGTTAPRAKMDVTGASISAPAGANSAPATTAVDFATGNIQYTSASCASNFKLNNMVDGGTYTFAVKGTTTGTCSFLAYSDVGVTALAVKMPPDHGPTTSGKMTLYTFLVVGTDVFVSWATGY